MEKLRALISSFQLALALAGVSPKAPRPAARPLDPAN